MKKFAVGAVLAALSAHPALAQDAAQADSRAGFRIEGRGLYETPTVSDVDDTNDVYKIGSAVAVGAEAGFDIAVGKKVVLGPYATFDKSGVDNCEGTDCVRINDTWGVGMHLGYTVSDKGMVYGKLGYASMKVEVEGAINGTPFKVNDNSGGFGGEFGYEHAFSENFFGRVFGGYEDHGKVFDINFQRRLVGIALGARF